MDSINLDEMNQRIDSLAEALQQNDGAPRPHDDVLRAVNLENELEKYVLKADFDTAIADLDERKADRSELEERFNALKDMINREIDSIDIPAP